VQADRVNSCVICGTPLGHMSHRRTCQNATCPMAYQQHLRAGRPTCTECGRPLSTQESRAASVCQDVHCQVNSRASNAIASRKRCSVCRTRLAPDRCTEDVCDDGDCSEVARWRKQAELTNVRHARFLEQTTAAAQLRDELATEHGIIAPQQFFVTVIPRFANLVAALPDQRRKTFRKMIELLVDELVTSPDASIERNEPPLQSLGEHRTGLDLENERLVGLVCAACGGFCCWNGDTHAYLRVETLRRLLLERPELHIKQIVDLYVGFLPERSFENSCVFHAQTGCTLPREMRSDTCNSHYCDGQHSLRAALIQGAPPRAFVAKSDGDRIAAGRFVSGADGHRAPDPG